MRRTIEKLSQQRKEKQDAFAKELEGLKKHSQKLSSSDNTIRLQHLLSRMQEIVSTKDISSDTVGQQVSHALTEFQKTLDKNIFVDLHELVCGTSSVSCPVFTNDVKLISFDGGHLTKDGAQYIGRILFQSSQLGSL